jgi:hypothetical protein
MAAVEQVMTGRKKHGSGWAETTLAAAATRKHGLGGGIEHGLNFIAADAVVISGSG